VGLPHIRTIFKQQNNLLVWNIVNEIIRLIVKLFHVKTHGINLLIKRYLILIMITMPQLLR
jgi:hypothetical protein